MKLLNILFIALAVAGLATTLVPVSAQAGGMAFDAAGNLYLADSSKHSVFKYTAGRTKSTFGVTDAGMDRLLPLGRLEGNWVIQILSAFNCRVLGQTSR